MALAQAPAAAAPSAAPFVVEYYYKVKWGAFDEFKALFRKNHYPVLMKEQAIGRIARVTIDYPVYHATEDGRWDMRVTITFKDAATAFAPFDNTAILKELYPDRATFDREERRRFEIARRPLGPAGEGRERLRLEIAVLFRRGPSGRLQTPWGWRDAGTGLYCATQPDSSPGGTGDAS